MGADAKADGRGGGEAGVGAGGAGAMARFTATADAISVTPSKRAKVAALAGYLRTLDGERLRLVTRYFAGRPFATGDGRTLSVGGATLRAVLLALGDGDEDALARSWRRHADAGDWVHDVLAGRSGAPLTTGLDVLDVDAALSRIAGAAGSLARVEALRQTLAACNPAEGRYITKLITRDMRIGLRQGLVEEALAVAFARGPGEVARADMLLGDLGEVSVLAAEDRLNEARPRLFLPLRYMLASPVSGAEEVVRRLGDEVWVEDKYDGIRCQVHRGPGRVALYSRDLRDITGQFPEVVKQASLLPVDVILDGELLACRQGRALAFHDLQQRLGRINPGPAVLEEVPVIYVAWDILVDGGSSLLDEPLRIRRRRLEALARGGAFAIAHLSRARGAAEIDERFASARARRNEGLLLKDPDAAYMPGRRGLAWLKLKRPLDTLDVVVVGAEWGSGRRRGVRSDVTFAVRVDGGEELATIGKAYGGLTDAEIAAMTELLLDLTLRDHGHHRQVRPEIVLEVAFDAVRASRRHGSGYALRFPRIVRWRRDKPPAEIDTLSRVAELARADGGEPADQRIDQFPSPP